MRLTPSGRAVLLPLAIAIAAAAANGQLTFRGTGLPQDWASTSPHAISADGTTVVGWGYRGTSFDHVPFRWTLSDGVEQLGPQPDPGHLEAVAVSQDGSVVVGVRYNNGPTYRWTHKAGFVQLPSGYPGGSVIGRGISADGSTIVGSAAFTWAGQAFRWNSTPSLHGLGGIMNAASGSSAGACSADGSVICGSGVIESGSVAFRWTAATGMESIGDLPGGPVSASARAISADGTTIVGQSRSALGYEAFRWTAAGGMQPLGSLPAGTSSDAIAVSADGSVVVGYTGVGAFIWTPQDGMRSLRSLLLAAGITDDWDLDSARGISADGRVITGMGRRYTFRPVNYVREGWVLTLGPTLCAANCDGSTTPPVLNVNDFQCFLGAFSAGLPYANCDGSTAAPALNVLDFMCFQQRFAAGCP